MARTNQPLRPIAWKPRVSIVGTIGGLMMGLSAVVLLQQYGKLYPDRAFLIESLVAGAVVGGLVVPSLVRLRAVGRINAAVARVRTRRRANVPEAAVPPVAPPVPVAPEAPGWLPTHAVPAAGAQAWSQPDPNSQPAATLDAGSQLRLLQTQGDWAQVQAQNGWVGWVDVRALTTL
jgi:hypothetical protein